MKTLILPYHLKQASECRLRAEYGIQKIVYRDGQVVIREKPQPKLEPSAVPFTAVP